MGREAQATGKALILPGLGRDAGSVPGALAAPSRVGLQPWDPAAGCRGALLGSRQHRLVPGGFLCWAHPATEGRICSFWGSAPFLLPLPFFQRKDSRSDPRLPPEYTTAGTKPPVTSPHSPHHHLQQGRCPGPGSPWCCRRAQPGAAAGLSLAARPRSVADLQLVFSLIYVTAYLCPLLKTIPFVSAVNETVYHPAAAGLLPEMSFAPVLIRHKSF